MSLYNYVFYKLSTVLKPLDVIVPYPMLVKFENTNRYIYIQKGTKVYISYEKNDILRNHIHKDIYNDRLFYLRNKNRVYNTDIKALLK